MSTPSYERRKDEGICERGIREKTFVKSNNKHSKKKPHKRLKREMRIDDEDFQHNVKGIKKRMLDFGIRSFDKKSKGSKI